MPHNACDTYCRHALMNITVNSLSFTHADQPLFQCLSLRIEPGEIVAIIGSSGCGKTTLLRLLSGDLVSDSVLSGPSSLMTQQDLLLPWKSVLDNATLGFEIANRRKCTPEERESAKALLIELGLGDVLEAFPDTLSVGMRQRVSLARAVFNECQLLLLDEPFSALDVITREKLYEVLRHIHAKKHMTLVFATHDLHDALALADRILLLSNGNISQAWDIPIEARNTPTLRSVWRETLRDALRHSNNQEELLTSH